ncbi:MAG TPA: hypothetical protein H9677_02470 [Firmicutes bacterium]|nr:hypothetical protein [Bacillota bacterium]
MMKILRFSSRPDVNGNIYLLDIDTLNERFWRGYHYRLCDSGSDVRITKKEIKKLIAQLIWLGFKEEKIDN